MNLKQKILLGVTGTVATSLTRKIVEGFIEKGFDVGLVFTEKAKSFIDYSDLIGTGHSGIFDDSNEWPTNNNGEPMIWEKGNPIAHIDLREMYSAYVVICSANTLAKIANGICDNLVTSIARAWPTYKPFIIAPAMNTTMWEHSTTEKHLKEFEYFSKNNKIVFPAVKKLACGTMGIGALANIEKIVSVTESSLVWKFPIRNCYGLPINPHPGAFGFSRKDSRHTGVDIYTDLDEPVYAVEEGTIVGIEHFTGDWDNSPWWNNTDCVLIKGATGVVLYGEISVDEYWVRGSRIQAGEYLGKVMRVIKEGRDHYEITGWRPTMLHMELYPHDTLFASHGFEEHLLNDPTPFLLKNNGWNNPKTVTYDSYKA